MGSDCPTTSHVNDSMNNTVAEQESLATQEELENAFKLSDGLRYIKNDTFVADPSLLLGFVYYEMTNSEELSAFLTAVEVDVAESSVLTAPQTVSELIIDSRISGSTNIFSLISLSAGQDEVVELRVINNVTARAITRGKEWNNALSEWMDNSMSIRLIENPNVSSITIVTGVVQKYITSKKFSKFEAGTKGGAFGINVAGKLYTSSSDFKLDIIYGIDLATIDVRGVDVQEISRRVAEGKVIRQVEELKLRDQLFDKMAMRSKSVFPLTC